MRKNTQVKHDNESLKGQQVDVVTLLLVCMGDSYDYIQRKKLPLSMRLETLSDTYRHFLIYTKLL